MKGAEGIVCKHVCYGNDHTSFLNDLTTHTICTHVQGFFFPLTRLVSFQGQQFESQRPIRRLVFLKSVVEMSCVRSVSQTHGKKGALLLLEGRLKGQNCMHRHLISSRITE